MKNIQILLILTLFAFVFACQQGEQGDIGPAGANGAKGATGDKGEVGITDSKGMLYSNWIEVKAADWSARNGNNTLFAVAYTLTGLTADIANKGNVFFYMQPSGASFVYPMPYSEANETRFVAHLFNNNNTQAFQISYRIFPSLGGTKLTTNYKFRLVIIPAGARMAASVDMSNYESVKKYLDLHD